MIKNIVLNNFKCFKEAHVDFNLINVFIGPNGSGKSSIAQALMVLKQSIDKRNLNLKEPINLGEFKDILHFKAEPHEITISLNGEIILHVLSALDESLQPFVNISYTATFNESGLLKQQRGLLQSGNLNIILHNFPELLKIEAKWSFYEKFLSQEEINFGDVGSIDLKCGELVGQPVKIGEGSIGTGKEYEYREYENMLGQIFDSVESMIRNTYYVPGLRGMSIPTYEFYDEEVKELIQNKAISADAEKLVTALGEYPEIAGKASTILKSIIGTEVQYKIAPGRKQTIDVLRHNWKTTIVNEGLGLNQMLFPFFQMLMAPVDSFIIIEEPELHLHPRAQAKFVDELVNIAKREQKQLLLITHSEHILFRLLTLVVKEELHPKELNIYSFSLSSTGAKQPQKLEISEDGRLEGALPGFFEHEIEELGEFLKAASESQ